MFYGKRLKRLEWQMKEIRESYYGGDYAPPFALKYQPPIKSKAEMAYDHVEVLQKKVELLSSALGLQYTISPNTPSYVKTSKKKTAKR